MKKSILISYQAMMVGGSTTSLLGMLHSIDYSKYDVELLLNTNTGELIDKLPQQVKLLPPAFKYPNHKSRKFHSILSPKYLKTYFEARRIAKQNGNVMHGVQYLESKNVIKFRRIDKEYDVAIAFLEGMNCKFVAKHIKARKKIAWIHIDYLASRFNPEYDIEAMSCFDHIVTVSTKCNESLRKAFPSLAERVHTIENIISYENISNLANCPVDFLPDNNYINLVTSCRIEFKAKALDRAVKVLGELNRSGELSCLRWYIIGDGNDLQELKQLIKDESLDDQIILLGQKVNPYPYIKKMDIFFLPSRFEGKPMAVTEGLMLGLPALVTNYSSAQEQVNSHFDGLIVDNDEEGIKNGIRYLINNLNEAKAWRQNINPANYIDNKAISQIQYLIEN